MTNLAITKPLKPQSEFTSGQSFPALFPNEPATRLATQRESCHVCGGLEDEGIAIKWHNFELGIDGASEWPHCYHSGSLRLCLNLAGHGSLCSADSRLSFEPLTTFVYAPANCALRAWRKPGERHRFLTIDFSACFLRDQLGVCERALHPVVRDFVLSEGPVTSLGGPVPLTAEHEQLVSLLLRSQCSQGPCQLRCKGIVLQLAADFLVEPCCGNEASCDRQRCLALERARRVVAILQRDLVEPPTLEEIGHEVGCSPFHLSRTFSREMGMTIPQCLRTLRMRYAAELLKSGRCNVTEAAMAVGYSSLSHFSQAFCQAIGCCPAMYSSSNSDEISATCAAFPSDRKEQLSHEDRRADKRLDPEIDVMLESLR